jgi:predicted aminopeptidase
VEEEGLGRWLDREGTPAQRTAYVDSRGRQAEFAALVLKYRARLADFYAKPLATGDKREGKRRLFEEMSGEYAALKASWGGFAGFDRLIARGLNNAFLVSIASYTELLPAFRALLAQKKGELPAFYDGVRYLAKLDKPERDARLAALAASGR